MQSEVAGNVETGREVQVVRKVICRYGRGCTHVYDPTHRDKFWHPHVPQLDDEIIRMNYICNECGAYYKQLEDLRLHLIRKTAWSNNSLVGCRISCLVELKEWHEGFVIQFHKSGKHCVEFRQLGEKRWLNMKKVAFYIVERPQPQSYHNSEYKDDETSAAELNLAPIEDNWVYSDDISLEYAFAQSVLFKIFGGNVQETGHKTRGHLCVTDMDKDYAKSGKGSLLYGELLPRGANKALSRRRLNAGNACTLFDMGMGTGKVVLQAFLQYTNLRYVFGVELSEGRYRIAEDAILSMIELLGPENFRVTVVPGKRIVITQLMVDSSAFGETMEDEDESCTKACFQYAFSNLPGSEWDQDVASLSHIECSDSKRMDSYKGKQSPRRKNRRLITRMLHVECGDMFAVPHVPYADIIMLETDIPQELHPQLCRLLDGMKENSRTLTYLDMKKVWSNVFFGYSPPIYFPYKQLDSNKSPSDRFPTSWSVQRGHHFFIWVKVRVGQTDGESRSDKGKEIASTSPANRNSQSTANGSSRGSGSGDSNSSGSGASNGVSSTTAVSCSSCFSSPFWRFFFGGHKATKRVVHDVRVIELERHLSGIDPRCFQSEDNNDPTLKSPQPMPTIQERPKSKSPRSPRSPRAGGPHLSSAGGPGGPSSSKSNYYNNNSGNNSGNNSNNNSNNNVGSNDLETLKIITKTQSGVWESGNDIIRGSKFISNDCEICTSPDSSISNNNDNRNASDGFPVQSAATATALSISPSKKSSSRRRSPSSSNGSSPVLTPREKNLVLIAEVASSEPTLSVTIPTTPTNQTPRNVHLVNEHFVDSDTMHTPSMARSGRREDRMHDDGDQDDDQGDGEYDGYGVVVHADNGRLDMGNHGSGGTSGGSNGTSSGGGRGARGARGYHGAVQGDSDRSTAVSNGGGLILPVFPDMDDGEVEQRREPS